MKAFECNNIRNDNEKVLMPSNETIKISNIMQNKKSIDSNKNIEHATKEIFTNIIDVNKKSQNVEDITFKELDTFANKFLADEK